MDRFDSSVKGLEESDFSTIVEERLLNDHDHRADDKYELSLLNLNLDESGMFTTNEKVGSAHNISFNGENRKGGMMSKEQVLDTIESIFDSYAEFSITTMQYTMSMSSFEKFTKRIQVFGRHDQKRNKLYLMYFSKASNKQLNFEDFKKCLIYIARSVCGDAMFKKSPTTCFTTFLKECVIPLRSEIKNNEPKKISNSKLPYTKKVHSVLESVSYTIKEIYRVYFVFECIEGSPVHKQNLVNDSTKKLFAFLKDFSICPDLVNFKTAFSLFESMIKKDLKNKNDDSFFSSDLKAISQMMNSKDLQIGKIFTLGHFYIFLYRISLHCFYEETTLFPANLLPINCLLKFLKSLESSEGFSKVRYKLSLPFTAKYTLRPNILVIEDIMRKSGLTKKESSSLSHLISNASTALYSPQHNRSMAQLRKSGENSMFNTMSDENFQVVQFNYKELENLFKHYSMIGNKMNDTRIKLASFVRFLKDAALIKQESASYKNIFSFKTLSRKASQSTIDCQKKITQAQSGLLFAKYTRNKSGEESPTRSRSPNLSRSSLRSSSPTLPSSPSSNSGSLTFERFINLLEELAVMIYDKQQKPLAEFIQKVILPLNEKLMLDQKPTSDINIEKFMQILDNENMVKLLTLAHELILPYFKCYANHLGTVEMHEFIRFCKEFDIFPSIVSKANLFVIFQTFAKINSISLAPNSFCLDNNEDALMSKNFRSAASLRIEKEKKALAALDEHLFIESLALIAILQEGYDDEFDESSRSFAQIMDLLIRMHYSPGVSLCKRPSLGSPTRFPVKADQTDLLTPLKKAFPTFFEDRENKIKDESYEFEELLDWD